MVDLNSTNFIITDPTQMPYYCAKYQVLCGSHTWKSHLIKKKVGKAKMNFKIEKHGTIE